MTTPFWTREIIQQRALEYVDLGQFPQAVNSAIMDAAKREQERADLKEPLWTGLQAWAKRGVIRAVAGDVPGVRAWIEEMP
jgi:hypothetical protein